MLTSRDILPHATDHDEIVASLNTDKVKGLSTIEVEARLRIFGNNRITREKEHSVLIMLLAQFRSPIVFLLLTAAGLSFWLTEWADAIAILIVLLVNSLIGFFMEFQAERSMNALKKLSISQAKVIRNGLLTEINSEDVVPGDISFVEAGDLIPADGRIFSLSQLQTDESPLTGESLPVAKQTEKINTDTLLAERSNMLYKGTYVTKGNGYFITTGTGMSSELGQVARLVESAEQAVTPLEKKLEDFSRKLIKITIVLVAIVFLSGLLSGQKIIGLLESSIALAVAAIPEGLPIVATMALAQGVIKMARHKVIIKKLSAVETLGGTSVICTDKTGTLTKNKIEVSGTSLAPGTSINLFYEAIVLCNTAELYRQGDEEKEIGDPLETGLLRFATSQGVDINLFRQNNPKLKEEAFSSETKIMATLHKGGSGYTVYAKGAVEELIDRCNRTINPTGEIKLTDEEKNRWLKEAETMAASGLRVISVAYKRVADEKEVLSSDLVFLGLIGMVDPPREEVFAAIEECGAAGIKVIMITGDHPATALNIAGRLKIGTTHDAKALTGKEMKDYEALSDLEKVDWSRTSVFARVSPLQKLDIIKVFQERKNVVAMTGDGINDAPALKKADIGVAMGQRGTQVAQEAANMVLKDDSFSSIVVAIKQGRIIFDNIQKFVVYLLSSNLSELLVISFASVFNFHFQLFPIQVLFINLISDVLPALALGITEGSGSVMNKPPRKITKPIIDRHKWISIFIYAGVIGLASIGAVLFSHVTLHKTELWNPELCNNILFFTLIFSQLLHVLNMGEGRSFFKSEVMKSKYVWGAITISMIILLLVYAIEPIRSALSVHTLTTNDWLVISAASLSSLLIIQLIKRTGLIRNSDDKHLSDQFKKEILSTPNHL